MIEKLVGPIVNVLADLIPGYKTAVVAATAIGMVICELSNQFYQYGHSFDAATWAAIPTTAVATIAIRKYREMKEELHKIERGI